MTPKGGHAAPPRAGGPPSLPINLSLSEDERSPPGRPAPGGGAAAAARLREESVPAGLRPRASNEEDEEQLYEYFPLSLDDW